MLMSRHYFASAPVSRGRLGRGLLGVLGLCAGLLGVEAYAGGGEVRFAYLGSDQDPAYLGVKQGLDEANLQGRFLGQSYAVDILDPATPAGPDLSPYVAVLSSADAARLTSLAEKAAGRPVFNLHSDDEALR
ncbi:MAG: hypothetical protein ACREUU_20040, partial [Gammaproteobacteria bacterium]